MKIPHADSYEIRTHTRSASRSCDDESDMSWMVSCGLIVFAFLVGVLTGRSR